MFADENARSRSTLYTDALVIRGLRPHRPATGSPTSSTTADDAFIVLADVTMDEWGTDGSTIRADFAQVNLDAVLFAVANAEVVEATPELRTPKIRREAIISVPPFKVVGTSTCCRPRTTCAQALNELTGRFLPVTDATTGPTSLGEARRRALLVAVNHARAQILAPHKDVDPWAGLDPSRVSPRPRRPRRSTPTTAHAARRPDPLTAGGRPGPPIAAAAAARLPRRPGLALDGQVQAVAPFGPAAVVDRDVVVAQQRQHEGELGGGDARAVVADEPTAARDARLEQLRPQIVRVAEALRCPARCIAPTGTLIAPGMWPSRRALPS